MTRQKRMIPSSRFYLMLEALKLILDDDTYSLVADIIYAHSFACL